MSGELVRLLTGVNLFFYAKYPDWFRAIQAPFQWLQAAVSPDKAFQSMMQTTEHPSCHGRECMELSIHFPVLLCGFALNYAQGQLDVHQLL
jgi:hypothetical protein